VKKQLIALTLIISSICATSCAQQQKPQKQQAIGGVESSVSKMGDIERVKITSDTANVRTGCSGNAPVAQKSNKDNTFDVVSQVSDWFAVKLPDNNIGFVPKSQCTPIVAEDKKPTTTPDTSGTVPQGTNTPKTPATETTSTTLTDAEQKMVNLVNEARAQNNLPPLTVDMQLANVARTKAQDMIDNNYFSHNSPKYGSPFDMMKSFGIKFVQAGENIAGNQSVENAENALMNSPGHRQNILNPNYTHIGIGIKAGGPYGNMFSQMFISKPR